MIKVILKVVLALACFGVLLIGVYAIFIIYVFGGFDKDYSITELKQDFIENKTEIYELKRYFTSIVPKDKSVYIEYQSDNVLFRFGISNADGYDFEQGLAEWDIRIDSKHMDSIMRPLGWTKETLYILKQKLDDADFIGITSGEPVQIDFKRSGMGMYTFNVFDKPIPNSLRTKYHDSCVYIYANSRLVLEYGGGALGGQCFYNFK